MRAVGLGRAQLAGTIVLESVLTAVFGTLLGRGGRRLAGVGAADGLRRPGADARSPSRGTCSPSWWCVSGVVGVVAALLPAARATALPVLDAVTTD